MANKDIITVLNGAVKLRQIDGGFKTSIDAVLLAAACPAKQGQSVLDMGCGVGSAGLCVMSRVQGATLKGIDIQDDHVECAGQNAELNGIIAAFEQGDIKTYKGELFDHIICNPPYEDAGAHLVSPSDKNAAARGHIDESTLDEWVKCAFNNLKSGGSFTMIHKAEKIHRIIVALGKSFGATEIIPLWPKQGKEAKRVIVRTIKHRKTLARISSGLILHNDDGTYTSETEKILRQGDKLE